MRAPSSRPKGFALIDRNADEKRDFFREVIQAGLDHPHVACVRCSPRGSRPVIRAVVCCGSAVCRRGRAGATGDRANQCRKREDSLDQNAIQ